MMVDGKGGLRSKPEVWHKYSGVSDDKIGWWRPGVIKIKALVSNIGRLLSSRALSYSSSVL